MKRMIIVGAGWYGLHIAYKLQDKYNITVLEKNEDIFMESSYNNQNRLHLGFHYPRSYKTRQLCKNGYDLFLNDYFEIVEKIDRNYYCISKESLLDFETYLHIYEHEKYGFEIVENDIGIENINGKLIRVDEMLINHKKAKEFFENKFKNVKIICGYLVTDVKQYENKVYVNDELKCDLLLDCTYGKLNLNDMTNEYLYEITVSYVYKKVGKYDADCITIMDGQLPSLFIRDKENELYSLTHVKYTPLFISKNKKEIFKYESLIDEIDDRKNDMEREIKKYIMNFDEIFRYESYYLGYKLKKIDNSDDRTCNINNIDNNIISVNGGKISGVYEFEKYIFSLLNI